jgi:hypothetical protein
VYTIFASQYISLSAKCTTLLARALVLRGNRGFRAFEERKIIPRIYGAAIFSVRKKKLQKVHLTFEVVLCVPVVGHLERYECVVTVSQNNATTFCLKFHYLIIYNKITIDVKNCSATSRPIHILVSVQLHLHVLSTF